MGLLLSVLVACVGVLEVIACYTHFRLGIVYNQCKSDVTDVARNYAWELRRNHLHHLFPDGQPELEYAKTVRAYREKTQSIGGSVTVDSCNVITTPSTSSYLRVDREDENAPSYSNRKPSQDDTTYDQISEIDVDFSEHIDTYDRICHVENDSKTKNETNETTDNLEKAIEIKSEVNETIKPVQESDAINSEVLNITDNAAVKISDNIEVYTKQSTAANLFFDSQNETQLTNILQQDVQLQTDECKEIKKDFPIKDTTLRETHQQKADETPASLLKQESTNDYIITQQIEDSAPVAQNLPQEPDASKDVKADSKPNTETNQVPDTSKPEEIAEKADINEAKHVVELKEHKTSDGVSKERVEQISAKTIVSEMQVSAETEYKTNASVDDEKVEQISEKAETITEIKHEMVSEAEESKTNESAIKQVEPVSEKAEIIDRTTHDVVDERKEPKTKESAATKQIEEVPEKVETFTDIKHEVVEESVVSSSEGTTHESEILKQSKTEKLVEKVSEPSQISAQEKLAENKTTNSSDIIEETKVSEAEIIESKTVPELLSTTKETPLNLQTLLEATGLKDVKESPELTVSTAEKSDNDTVTLGTNEIIDTTLQTKVVPLLNSKPELIERITETGRLLSPLPENKISETTTPTVIPDSLKATPEALPTVPSPETEDSTKTSEADLECEQILSNTSLQPEDPLAVPRVPSPYPMSLFGITTDNGISDLMVNEDLLRSLDGIKRSDDRRRSFKKKRSSSSSSRASRDRSLDAEPKSDTESQPEKREKPTPLVSVEEKNTGEEDVNQEAATSETSQNVDSSSTQKRDSASEIRKSFQKAAVNSFEEATPSQNDEMNRREMKKTNDNEKQQGSFPQTDAFWLIFSAEYTNAMEKDWHGQHFSCWQCDESLTGQRYVLRDEHPYCVKCYEQQFANSCEKCNRTIGIDSKDLSYKEKHWHEVCFQCTTCGESLVDKQFGAKGEKIYCGNCYDKQFASRCDGCGNIFHAGTKKMEYKNRQWHEACFCCCKCKNPIGTKSFIPREKDIYCAQCYEEKFATRCIKCNKAIQSGGVTYKNEPWHRECFTCTHCDKNLAGQRFTSRDDQPCCAECFGRLFAKRCTACDEPITGIGGTRFISFEDRHWHNDCFKCASCSTSLVGRGFITDADKIICPECAKERFM